MPRRWNSVKIKISTVTPSANRGSNTDWYKNALANSQVSVQNSRQKFRAGAIPVPAVEVAKQMQEITRRAPRVAALDGWSTVEGARPTWRPTDGFEGKGERAGRAITDFTLTRS